MKIITTKQTFKNPYSPFVWSVFTAFLCMASLAFNVACSTTQQAQAQATVKDAIDAGAVIMQAYVSLKTPVPASALKTGNTKVDQYLASSTNVLSAPPTQALVNDLFALAAKNPASVPQTSP